MTPAKLAEIEAKAEPDAAGLVAEAWLIRQIKGDEATVLAGFVFKSEEAAQAAALRLTNQWRQCFAFPVVSLANVQRLEELADKYKWQVRDTCTRAEAAEAEATRRRSQLAEALEKIKRLSNFDPKGNNGPDLGYMS